MNWIIRTASFALLLVSGFAMVGCQTSPVHTGVATIQPVLAQSPREGLIQSSVEPATRSSEPVSRSVVSAEKSNGRSFNRSLRQRLRGTGGVAPPTKLASLRSTATKSDSTSGSNSGSNSVSELSSQSNLVARSDRRSIIKPVAFQSQIDRSNVDQIGGGAGSGSRIQADDSLFYDADELTSQRDDNDDGFGDGSGNKPSGQSAERPKPEPSSLYSDDTTMPGDELFARSSADRLTLPEVLQSVVQCYPEIDVAIGEIEASQGEVLAKWGEFDSKINAHSISQPLGFYQTYRNGVGIDRPLYGGGKVFGGYRIGDGNFEPWYGERETNEAGEFKAGFDVPLLRDRDIDDRRGNLQAANFKQNQIEANVEARLLLIERAAIQSYWDWVASGQAVVIQRKLLELAEMRVDQIEQRIEQGDLAKIAEIDNDRFIAKRKNSLIKARRGLEKSAIKLSLFYRDASCCPVVASEGQLPNVFPDSQRLSRDLLQEGIGVALRTRPELVELQAARQEAVVKLQLANNLLLPKLDVKGSASQDIGGETSSLGDKTPFKLELGVFYEVPVQQRKGFGKIQSAQGKITQIDAKRQLVSDKIRAEIQDAASAVNAAYDQIRQSRDNVRLNEQSLELGRLAFEEGDIDLLALNIYESSVADARLQLLEAQFKYFFSLAIYQTKTRSQAFAGTDR